MCLLLLKYSNNSLKTSMAALSLSSDAIKTIVDDPSLLRPASSSSVLGSKGISPSTANHILWHGYTRGLRAVFLLNASLAAFAVVVSVFMIKHKELTRGDDEVRKAEAKIQNRQRSMERPREMTPASRGSGGTAEENDIEMGRIESAR